MLSIYTNTLSITTQRHMRRAAYGTQEALQRLSTGLRINSAKDDAAGLAISTRFDANIRGNNVAIRNTNDAISYTHTAETALAHISTSLLRMRDLAVQSASGTYSSSDRQSLNVEFMQLQAEITNIIKDTKFNDQGIFGGSSSTFQIGADSSETSRVNFETSDLSSESSKIGFITILNNGTSLTSVVSAKSSFISQGGHFSTSDGSAIGTGSDVIETVIANFEANIPTNDLNLFYNSKSAFTSTGGSFSATTGDPVVAKSATTIQANTVIPIPTATDIENYNTFITARDAYHAAVRGPQILDQLSATVSIGIVDNALNEVVRERSKYGAFETVLDGIISNLQASVTNQSASMSRIQDTDYAIEIAKLTKNQILNQAGSALLVQANLQPNTAIALLKGL